MDPRLALALLAAALATGVGVSLRPGSPVPALLDNTGGSLSDSLSAQSGSSAPSPSSSAVEFPTTTIAGGVAGQVAQGGGGGSTMIQPAPSNAPLPGVPLSGQPRPVSLGGAGILAGGGTLLPPTGPGQIPRYF